MTQTQMPQTDPKEAIGFMNIDETDFRSMTRPQHLRHLEVEGYVVFPQILDAETIARLKRELADQVIAALEPIQTRYREVTEDPSHIDTLLEESVARLRPIVDGTMDSVRRAMGHR